MCGERGRCQRPDRLKGGPEDCSPEQIRECHGGEGRHDCCDREKKDK